MRRIIEEKPSLNELYHYGVRGMKWGVRKDTSNGGQSKNGFKDKVIKASEKEIENEVKRYGAMESAERAPSKAYDDSLKILRAKYGQDLRKANAEGKISDEDLDLEIELLERYENYAFDYSKRLNNKK